MEQIQFGRPNERSAIERIHNTTTMYCINFFGASTSRIKERGLSTSRLGLSADVKNQQLVFFITRTIFVYRMLFCTLYPPSVKKHPTFYLSLRTTRQRQTFQKKIISRRAISPDHRNDYTMSSLVQIFNNWASYGQSG